MRFFFLDSYDIIDQIFLLGVFLVWRTISTKKHQGEELSPNLISERKLVILRHFHFDRFNTPIQSLWSTEGGPRESYDRDLLSSSVIFQGDGLLVIQHSFGTCLRRPHPPSLSLDLTQTGRVSPQSVRSIQRSVQLLLRYTVRNLQGVSCSQLLN